MEINRTFSPEKLSVLLTWEKKLSRVPGIHQVPSGSYPAGQPNVPGTVARPTSTKYMKITFFLAKKSYLGPYIDFTAKILCFISCQNESEHIFSHQNVSVHLFSRQNYHMSSVFCSWMLRTSMTMGLLLTFFIRVRNSELMDMNLERIEED